MIKFAIDNKSRIFYEISIAIDHNQRQRRVFTAY